MAQVQASRANTLDGFMDELPELSSGYFSFPVDDFFDNYVEELGMRGLQNGSAEAGARADPGQYDSLQVPAGQMGSQAVGQGRNALAAAMSLELPAIPDADALAQPVISLPQEVTPFVSTSGFEMPLIEAQNDNSLPPNSEEGSGVWEQQQAVHERGRAKRSAAHTDYEFEGGMDSDDSDQKPAKQTRGGGKTKRNAKQQVQNKQAQQRYRERRKQRFTEMEHAIDGLTAKLQRMQAVQSQNAMLQAKRDELEAVLLAKERELDQLRAQVQSSAARAPSEVEENTPEQRRKAEEMNARECQSKAAAHVQGLRDFIDSHGLRAANPTGEGVDPADIQKLAEMVGRGCNTCQTAMRAEGVKVLRLMSRDVAHLSRIDCLRQCNKWTQILETLRLTDLQKDQLLLMRKNHLRNLRQVYEVRQQLNMQAMSLMLPQAERAGPKDLDGRMACMSLRGYSSCARQTVDLDEILNSIRENLRLEQKHVMEMNFVTMHRLLSPLQAALFLVEVHPAYCDALALANILASQLDGAAPAEELRKVDSGNSHGHSSCSDNKSDTCPLMRADLDGPESAGASATCTDQRCHLLQQAQLSQ